MDEITWSGPSTTPYGRLARTWLESARQNDYSLYAGYVAMLILGLRRGELLALA